MQIEGYSMGHEVFSDMQKKKKNTLGRIVQASSGCNGVIQQSFIFEGCFSF